MVGALDQKISRNHTWDFYSEPWIWNVLQSWMAYSSAVNQAGTSNWQQPCCYLTANYHGTALTAQKAIDRWATQFLAGRKTGILISFFFYIYCVFLNVFRTDLVLKETEDIFVESETLKMNILLCWRPIKLFLLDSMHWESLNLYVSHLYRGKI